MLRSSRLDLSLNSGSRSDFSSFLSMHSLGSSFRLGFRLSLNNSGSLNFFDLFDFFLNGCDMDRFRFMMFGRFNVLLNRLNMVLNRFNVVLNGLNVVLNRLDVMDNRFLVLNGFNVVDNWFVMLYDRFNMVMDRFSYWFVNWFRESLTNRLSGDFLDLFGFLGLEMVSRFLLVMSFVGFLGLWFVVSICCGSFGFWLFWFDFLLEDWGFFVAEFEASRVFKLEDIVANGAAIVHFAKIFFIGIRVCDDHFVDRKSVV